MPFKTDSLSPGHEIPRFPCKVRYGVQNSTLLTGQPILTTRVQTIPSRLNALTSTSVSQNSNLYIYSQTQLQVYIYIIYYGQPVSVSLLDHLQALFRI